MNGREDDALEEREEDLRHLAERLVAEAAEDEGGRDAVAKEGAEARTEGPGSGGVVGDVENPLRGGCPFGGAGGDALETRGPAGGANTFSDGRCGDGQIVVAGQLDGGGDGEGDVAVLVRAGERRGEQDRGIEDFNRICAGGRGLGVGAGQRGAGIEAGHVRNGADGADFKRYGDFTDGVVGLGVLGESHEGAVGAKDAGLLAGDGAERGAEPLSVVERNVRNDGDEWIDDIGGVEAAAHADFENSEINVLLRKVQEGHGGKGLKETGQRLELLVEDELLACVMDAEVEACKVVVGDLRASDADTLIGADEVRRRIEAGAEARGCGNGGERGRGGAFAVGAGNEDRPELLVRIAKSRKERADLVEGELATGLAGVRGELGRHGAELIDSGGVRHEPTKYRRLSVRQSLALRAAYCSLVARTSPGEHRLRASEPLLFVKAEMRRPGAGPGLWGGDPSVSGYLRPQEQKQGVCGFCMS